MTEETGPAPARGADHASLLRYDPVLIPQGLYAKLVEAFKKMGLEVVPGKGAAFDPNVRTRPSSSIRHLELVKHSHVQTLLPPKGAAWPCVVMPKSQYGPSKGLAGTGMCHCGY